VGLHFTPERKREFNELHFTEAAPRYDLATRMLSFWRDARWKEHLLLSLPPLTRPVCLDLASGTGDLTFGLARRYPDGEIYGLDITAAMLEIARQRNSSDRVTFVQAEMAPLPYPDGYADIVTGGYALRNAPDLKVALREIHRVLKPDGVAAFLDFSKPTGRVLQAAEYWLLRIWGGLWGLILHGDAQVHGYISASLRSYPDRNQFKALVEEIGFQMIQRKLFFLGITEVLLLRKSRLRVDR
jgi:ubiquinone/menaquinone biosynthesis methyltransferase